MILWILNLSVLQALQSFCSHVWRLFEPPDAVEGNPAIPNHLGFLVSRIPKNPKISLGNPDRLLDAEINALHGKKVNDWCWCFI